MSLVVQITTTARAQQGNAMGNAANLARKACALSGLILWAGIVHAQAACPSPETLKTPAFDRGFHQEKYLTGMDKPLLSEGRMTAKGNEVVWHMLKPFDVKTMITPSGITQSVDGGDAMDVGSGTGEIAASVARSMAAMMRGEWDALRAMFMVKLPDDQARGDWQVGLTPLDDRLKSVLGVITVHGCSDVSSVDIVRPDGDREHIQFDTTAP